MGFHQVQNVDFHEKFFLVVKFTTIEVILMLLSHGWKLFQLNVNNAFVNGLLEETIYMTTTWI